MYTLGDGEQQRRVLGETQWWRKRVEGRASFYEILETIIWAYIGVSEVGTLMEIVMILVLLKDYSMLGVVALDLLLKGGQIMIVLTCVRDKSKMPCCEALIYYSMYSFQFVFDLSECFMIYEEGGPFRYVIPFLVVDMIMLLGIGIADTGILCSPKQYSISASYDSQIMYPVYSLIYTNSNQTSVVGPNTLPLPVLPA